MAITQLSVFLMNQPGALVDAIKSISDANINIRALSIAEANDFGILRIIVSDSDAVCKLLGDQYLFSRTEVVAAKMGDRSGALYPILVVLNEAKYNCAIAAVRYTLFPIVIENDLTASAGDYFTVYNAGRSYIAFMGDVDATAASACALSGDIRICGELQCLLQD